MHILKEKDQYLSEHEKKVNMSTSVVMLAVAAILIIVTPLFWIGIWGTPEYLASSAIFLIAAALFIISAVVCRIRKGRDSFQKVIFIIMASVAALIIGMYSSALAFLSLLIPVVISVAYFNPVFTMFTSVFEAVCMLGASLLKTYIRPILIGDMDIRFVRIEPGTTITFNEDYLFETFMRLGYDKKQDIWMEMQIELLSSLIVLLIVTLSCIRLTKMGRQIIHDQREEAEKQIALQADLAESRNKAMLSQIQPHFIFNVLNSIYELCDESPATAQYAISEFSDYLRTNVNVLEKKELVPFDEEVAFIKNYVNLEKLRFEDRIQVVYEIKDSKFMVPPISIEPLVENAIKHGICRKREGGTVWLSSRRYLNGYKITIADNGAGFDTEAAMDQDESHVGMKNSIERLRYYLGAEAKIESTPGKGTHIEIIIPERENSNESYSS